METKNHKAKITTVGTTSSKVYHALKQQILENILVANQPIRQDKIAAQFDVSKIPVREALKQLESEGLVEFKPRRGAFVTELNEADIIETLEIRLALECHALKLAIPNMTSADFDQAETILENYKQANDMEIWSELNRQFHHCLYAPCGLTKLISMIETIKQRTKAFIPLKVTQLSGLEKPHKEHLAILSACKEVNIELAEKLLSKHIENTKKNIKAYFRNQKLAKIKH